LETAKRIQGGLCAICKASKNLVPDHDHTTGTPRAALCHHCNKGLGFFLDSPEILETAAAYLRRWGK
jgi:hypothetical protein